MYTRYDEGKRSITITITIINININKYKYISISKHIALILRLIIIISSYIIIYNIYRTQASRHQRIYRYLYIYYIYCKAF